MEKLNTIFFYHLDRAIRNYRQYAQVKLKENGFTITVDQWMVLKVLEEDPDVSQVELSDKVLKDKASVTRIIDILVNGKYLKREIDPDNRRRSKLSITNKGTALLKDIRSVVLKNRRTALSGVDPEELETTQKVLQMIAENCELK